MFFLVQNLSKTIVFSKKSYAFDGNVLTKVNNELKFFQQIQLACYLSPDVFLESSLKENNTIVITITPMLLRHRNKRKWLYVRQPGTNLKKLYARCQTPF